ncbi:MAG: hypothetical protein GTO45_18280, partial [Candidatus Aminicenantes bacterium]|nr:hypothetical protein [Candidatus Aminicenantes bacterium]NIM80248.1 hypothetical protein [Candidatus Aminicenantes bacterium]NIN20111.1 hypothetical protein [Candidatus Aminicenantes bacterium]NIN43898.1 hypothetical protein [Candidatus Aminicenantes bacterium]NIN86707.1 hypothetical protein [Candidatus Aminicenantes bacterium]
IRLAEKAYYLNENNIARQILVDAAAETLERPFYNLNISHEGAVNSAVFSPSGHRILTASSDNTAKLWDLQGNCLATFRHGAEVYSARFSPDGTKILTASRDKTAKMWDLNGTLLTDLDMHTDVVIC